MLENPTSLDLIINKVSNYFNTSINLMKLKFIQTSTDMLANFIAYFVFILLLLISILFASIAFASWLNDIYHSHFAGYAVVSIGYLLLSMIAFLARNVWIKTPIQNTIIRKSILSIELTSSNE
jgi:hypothetical protein